MWLSGKHENYEDSKKISSEDGRMAVQRIDDFLGQPDTCIIYLPKSVGCTRVKPNVNCTFSDSDVSI